MDKARGHTIRDAPRARRGPSALRQLATFSALTRHMNSAPDSRTVLDAVAEAAATLLGARASQVWVDDRRAGLLRMEGAFGLPGGPASEPVSLRHGHGVVGLVYRTRVPQYLPDVAADPRWLNKESAAAQHIRSAAEIPLLAGSRIEGVLSFLFAERHRFGRREKVLMELLAAEAAAAIRSKRAEEEQRRAHEDTERLLSSLAWALIAVGPDDRVNRWSAVAEQTFGVAADRAVGRPLMDTGVAWDEAGVLDGMARCRAGETPVRLDSLPYRRPDGSDGILSLTIDPIQAVSGTGPGGVLLLGADVTQRRVLQIQVAQAQKLEAIGVLAAGVAHEMNTPIQFVEDNLHFLQDAHREMVKLLDAYRAIGEEQATAIPAERRAGLAAAEVAAELPYLLEEVPRAAAQSLEGLDRVADIVRALRHFAHPDTGTMVPTDLNQAVLSTLVMARNEIKHVADVETELGELPPVICHPGAIKHALLNLVVNAAHAVADGMGATGGRGRIAVSSRRDGDAVEVAVTDTGTGIPEGIRHRVFDPFFTTKPMGRGTGQGLTIVRSIVVECHGGQLWFETEPGRGSTFFVRLPVAGAPAGSRRDTP